jgi:hypothetical protein
MLLSSKGKLINNTQVAGILSNVLGRKIQHVKLDEKSRIEGLIQAGVSDYYARFLTRIEILASQDFENATGDAVKTMTGHPPKSFRQFVEENKATWSLL